MEDARTCLTRTVLGQLVLEWRKKTDFWGIGLSDGRKENRESAGSRSLSLGCSRRPNAPSLERKGRASSLPAPTVTRTPPSHSLETRGEEGRIREEGNLESEAPITSTVAFRKARRIVEEITVVSRQADIADRKGVRKWILERSSEVEGNDESK